MTQSGEPANSDDFEEILERLLQFYSQFRNKIPEAKAFLRGFELPNPNLDFSELYVLLNQINNLLEREFENLECNNPLFAQRMDELATRLLDYFPDDLIVFEMVWCINKWGDWVLDIAEPSVQAICSKYKDVIIQTRNDLSE